VSAVDNMQIESTTLGVEDHGCLSFWLHLKGAGCSIGFGGYALDQWSEVEKRRVGHAFGTDAVLAVLRTVGAGKWEDLPGKYVRVKWRDSGGLGDSIQSIGNVIEDKWLDLACLAERAKGGSS
jgi:hypothetical protein